MQNHCSVFHIGSGRQRLAVEASGPEQAPCLVLIHGYPDNRRLWDQLVPLLSTTFYVVRYDVRGAGESSAPSSTQDYAARWLIDDLIAVIQHVRPSGRVHLVGVDWGALQAWEAVLSGRVTHLLASFTCTTPALEHAGAWLRSQLQPLSLRGSWAFAQRLAQSSYMMLFQIPWLPEALWASVLTKAWPKLLQRLEGLSVEPDAHLMGDAQRGVALYRANLQTCLLRHPPRATQLPVQAIVLQKDPFVNPELFQGFKKFAPDLAVEHMACGHWGSVTQHAPEFARHLRHFVAGIEARNAAAAPTAPAKPRRKTRAAVTAKPKV